MISDSTVTIGDQKYFVVPDSDNSLKNSQYTGECAVQSKICLEENLFEIGHFALGFKQGLFTTYLEVHDYDREGNCTRTYRKTNECNFQNDVCCGTCRHFNYFGKLDRECYHNANGQLVRIIDYNTDTGHPYWDRPITH